ncbi:hypothetical protein HYX13_02315 [Candidatus Woesearchaeota archaeon]|nr:hypothetical protein [Candidatus Woesearchaeota archaeon]
MKLLNNFNLLNNLEFRKNLSKKAMSEMWWILATAMIVLVVVAIILVFFKGGADKLFGGLGGQISGLDDCDGDKTTNSFDVCPCVKGTLDGCPTTKPSDEEKKAIGDCSHACVSKTSEEK